MTNVGKNVEGRGTLCTVEGNVYWHSNYEKQYGVSSKNKKIEIPPNPDITLLRVYI